MATRINSEKLQIERKRRAWTQQHLADVSGLGIRTIQRIERSGTASPESIQAIASCFDLNAEHLIILPSDGQEPAQGNRFRWFSFMVAALAIMTIGSFASIPFVKAKDVTLTLNAVVTAENNRYGHVGEMILSDGEESEFQMNGVFRVLITPTILENSQVLVALKIFAYVDGRYVLTNEPALKTMSGHEAEFSLALKDEVGSRIRISVLPEL